MYIQIKCTKLNIFNLNQENKWVENISKPILFWIHFPEERILLFKRSPKQRRYWDTITSFSGNKCGLPLKVSSWNLQVYSFPLKYHSELLLYKLVLLEMIIDQTNLIDGTPQDNCQCDIANIVKTNISFYMLWKLHSFIQKLSSRLIE